MVALQAPLSKGFPRQECWSGAISFSKWSFWPRDLTHVSCTGRRILHHWAIREALIWIWVGHNSVHYNHRKLSEWGEEWRNVIRLSFWKDHLGGWEAGSSVRRLPRNMARNGENGEPGVGSTMQVNLRIIWLWQRSSLVVQTVKCLPTVWETWVQSLAQEDLLEKEMATHSHGSRSLVGYSPWGCKESDTTEWLHSLHFTHSLDFSHYDICLSTELICEPLNSFVHQSLSYKILLNLL